MTAPVVAIAAGTYHSVALDAGGNVWTWGQGTNGALGNGATTNVATPAMLTGISNVIAVAAGAFHTLALTADKTVWTWGTNSLGELGRTGDSTVPGQVSPSILSNVVAIAGGNQFSLAVTGDGWVYAWGDNTYAELATNSTDVPYTNIPIRVDSLSHAVLVSAPAPASCAGEGRSCDGGKHIVAMTLDGGTNRYLGWGDNSAGTVGNGSNGYGVVQYTPAQVQFCTRCQRCVQLGTGGTFTAQCNGTLYLYFNTDDHSSDSTGTNSYTATVIGLATNVPVPGAAANGVAFGPVTVGNTYTFSASGLCQRDANGDIADPDGKDRGSNQVDCSFMNLNITNAICPAAKCFSLVGKIQ